VCVGESGLLAALWKSIRLCDAIPVEPSQWIDCVCEANAKMQ
jgi:hypothetical protein